MARKMISLEKRHPGGIDMRYITSSRHGSANFLWVCMFMCCVLISTELRMVESFVFSKVPSLVTGGLLRVPTNHVAAAAAAAQGTVFPVQKMMEGDDFCEDELGEGDLDTPSVMLDDLNWRVEKLRLEEQNIQRFLKSGPRHLPYEECRKWVQAWNRWDTEDDWREWINMGEKRNTYIPASPDEYYGRLGQWISWDHFLGKAEAPDTNNNGASNDSNEDNDD